MRNSVRVRVRHGDHNNRYIKCINFELNKNILRALGHSQSQLPQCVLYLRPCGPDRQKNQFDRGAIRISACVFVLTINNSQTDAFTLTRHRLSPSTRMRLDGGCTLEAVCLCVCFICSCQCIFTEITESDGNRQSNAFLTKVRAVKLFIRCDPPHRALVAPASRMCCIMRKVFVFAHRDTCIDLSSVSRMNAVVCIVPKRQRVCPPHKGCWY